MRTALYNDRGVLVWGNNPYQKTRVKHAIGRPVWEYGDTPEDCAELKRRIQTCIIEGRVQRFTVRACGFFQTVKYERIYNLIIATWQPAPDVELSDREVEVLRMIANGLTPAQKAKRLGVKPSTVTTFRTRLYKKTGAKSVAGLVRWAIRFGFVDP